MLLSGRAESKVVNWPPKPALPHSSHQLRNLNTLGSQQTGPGEQGKPAGVASSSAASRGQFGVRDRPPSPAQN